jgi:hypothetical protein
MPIHAPKMNMKSLGNQSTNSRLNDLKLAVLPRCYKLNDRVNPPSCLNSGDAWHTRKVVLTSLADSSGTAILTAGSILASLSGNAANIPIRISRIRAWAIAGPAQQYPPTFIQVNFLNEEFCQTFAANAAIRDSVIDAGGQGSGPPGVGLGVPTSLQLTRADWGTASTTQIAQAVSLPSGARVMWQVSVCFKF